MWNKKFAYVLNYFKIFKASAQKRARNLVVSDLHLETKGSRFESGATYVQRWTLCSNCPVNV